MIKTDLTLCNIDSKDLAVLQPQISQFHKVIRTQTPEMENAWVELPNSVGADEIALIKQTADWVRKNSDVLLVIGIGGSFLGTFAGLQLLCDTKCFPVEFLGTSFDPVPIAQFFEKYGDKRICVNVVSKSGTTMEITAAFEIVNDFMRGKYPNPDEYKKRIIVTTDAVKGKLREFVNQNEVQSFVIPNRVGGRYSVLSAVGLFPFAVAGLDIDLILKGAKSAYKELGNDTNDAYKYAAARYILHTKQHKKVEVLASFHQNMVGISAWWRQLFGESEGKEGKGLFPSHMFFSRDLHSMGQYIQQGAPLLIETVLNVQTPPAQSHLNKINTAAFEGTIRAHADAGVPVIVLNMERIDAANFGYMMYFFETACAMSAYLLGVNPFDQLGVEFYKNNMKDLLKN